MKQAQLNAKAAGLSLGIFWALALFIWTLVAASNGWGQDALNLLVGVYPYYEITTVGAVWGLVWGFLDGLIGGVILVAVYNFFASKLAK